MKYFRGIIWAVVAFLYGCSDPAVYYQLRLTNDNPTRHVFDRKRETIIKRIKRGFQVAKNDFRVPQYFRKAECKNLRLPDTLAYIKDEDFFYLSLYSDIIWNPSYCLYQSKNGEALSYFGRYIIRLLEKEENKTEIIVLPYDTKIYVGRTWRGKLFGWTGHTEWITKSVPSTTIEEYAILLGIGEKLGETYKMPPLVLPDEDNRIFIDE